MNTEILFNILEIIVVLALGGATLYFKTNASLKNKVGSYIAEAEDAYKETVRAGGMKQKYVVSKLYALVPSILKPIFTEQMLAELVENTFAAAESYAKTQLDKIVNKIENK